MVGDADRAVGGGGVVNGDVVHRLGAVVGTVLVAGWLVRAVGAARRERTVRRRLTALLTPQPARTAPRRAEVLGAVRRMAAAGGNGGCRLGPGRWRCRGRGGPAGRGSARRWRSRQAASGTAAAETVAAEAARQMPLAADLLAACIAAGAGPVAAPRRWATPSADPSETRWERGAAEVRLGGEPGGSWRGLAVIPGAGPLARLLERADVSGLPRPARSARLAAQARADWGPRHGRPGPPGGRHGHRAGGGCASCPRSSRWARTAGGDRARGRGAGDGGGGG